VVEGSEIPSSRVETPRKVYNAMVSLLREHKESRETEKDTAIRFIEGIVPENKGLGGTLRPIIDQWLNVKKSFMEITHESASGESIDEKEIVKRFESFENIMAGLIRGFFKTLKGLDEILENANN
jgi:hypothetical protein